MEMMLLGSEMMLLGSEMTAGVRDDAGISREEFTEQFREAFDTSDLDSSGSLDRDEFDNLYASAPIASSADAPSEFDERDNNNDARLDFSEFISREIETFDCLDGDFNGKLDQEETVSRLYQCRSQKVIKIQ